MLISPDEQPLWFKLFQPFQPNNLGLTRLRHESWGGSVLWRTLAGKSFKLLRNLTGYSKRVRRLSTTKIGLEFRRVVQSAPKSLMEFTLNTIEGFEMTDRVVIPSDSEESFLHVENRGFRVSS
jgi:hypothetical protein